MAKNGRQVTVLDKNNIIGGGLQSFCRNGISFDTGMHVMGGWRDGGTLDRLTRYIGIRNSLKLRDIDDNCMDEITVLRDDTVYRISASRNGFIDSLVSYFPDSKSELENYIDSIERIANSFDLFNLRPYDFSGSNHKDPDALIAADVFIEKYVSDHRLRSVLAYINGLYDGRRGSTPAYIHALIMSLYLNGATRFVDNTIQLALNLKSFIEENGGNVLSGCEVIGIECGDRKIVESVICANQKRFEADCFVWAAHPEILMNIAPPRLFTKAYKDRIMGIRPSCSAFGLYIELEPEKFPYINHTCYVHDDLLDPWSLGTVDQNGIPRGMMYMTPPRSDNDSFAHTILVTALMDFKYVEKWQDSNRKTRPDDYLAWKRHVAEGMISKIESAHPVLRDCIKRYYTSSPLTIRDYYGSPRGAIYGFSKDCNNLLESTLPIVTKSPNLFLTGQCVNLHGICGVPLTAMMTADTLLYPHSIISDLQDF